MDERVAEAGGVGRVALRATDRDRLTDFYESVLGLRVRRETADRTVLGTADRSLVVLLAAPDAPPRGAEETGLFHLALRVPARGALADALARIEADWDLSGASDHRVSEALYLEDPEGNGVEVYRDRPRAEWPQTPDGGVAMDTLPLDLDALRDGADESPASVVPSETDVGHVHLEASDLATSRAFYVEGLGLRERARYGDAATFLAVDDYHHHVGLNTWNGRTGPGPGRGLAWWELLVADERTVDEIADRLAARGADVERPGDEVTTGAPASDGDRDALIVTDPDGTEVRIRPRAGASDGVDE